MHISEILSVKGTLVVTIRPEATVRELVALLREHNLGAVVVSIDQTTVHGIVSERDVIRALAAAGTTVLLTTQYLEEADQLADRIAVLDGGRVVASGTPDELKDRLGGETVEVRSHSGDLLRAVPTDGTVTGLRRALDTLDESGSEGTVQLRRPSLDDVFLALTGHAATPGTDEHDDELEEIR